MASHETNMTRIGASQRSHMPQCDAVSDLPWWATRLRRLSLERDMAIAQKERMESELIVMRSLVNSLRRELEGVPQG